MTGISYMIPIVVAGGILYAFAKGFGGWDIGTKAAATDLWTVFWFDINTLGSTAMTFAVPVMTAGIAGNYSGTHHRSSLRRHQSWFLGRLVDGVAYRLVCGLDENVETSKLV